MNLFFYFQLAIAIVGLVGSCTNYSASKSKTAPPIIISIASSGSGIYTMVVRAQNPEILFQGYRMYPSATIKDSRTPADLNVGFDCLRGTALPILPNQPIDYNFEIHPSGGAPSSGVACRFQASLSAGTYITLRSILFGINLTSSSGSYSYSGPSNTVVLPP